MENITYILDFDRTLFNVDESYKVPIFQERKELVGTIEGLTNIDLPEYIFEDAQNFLNSHAKNNLHIVSSCKGTSRQWGMEYQKEKIQRSGVGEFVSSIEVVEDGKVAAVQSLVDGTKSVFVDDSAEHLEAVLKQCPEVLCIQIIRPSPVKRITPTTNPVIPIIQNLSQLDDIINMQ